MIDALLSQWLAAGQDFDGFWSKTPRQVIRIVDAANRARLVAHDAARQRNYELAALIAHAHHAPDKMPKFAPTVAAAASQKRSKELEAAQKEADIIVMRGRMMAAARRAAAK